MRLMIFYDLPFDNKQNVRSYNTFRNNLFKEGFHMMQYSIYSKVCYNKESVDYVMKRINKFLPKQGNVRFLTITEKQYQNIKIVVGKKSDRELLIDDRRFIEI
ncbi:CRISPR-associated protein Cas2 [Spiroplasma helicoides]|uniref:CRISPR-associated endoribonuclease Cas2 n=1 Tax=Spiroplasma helicoides TaxID=216938 RepID=A0A1B3SLV4_9MOLU|nr:CRISPR-associated endonuclease Cas2 [Spiroplasma helicoides]AOG60897.1 CRISPR-associated protein Cas2 [Spiroplasma helicoides]